MPIQLARSISTPRRRDAGTRQEGWRELCPLPTGAHEALITAGQNNGQDAGEDRGRDAGQNDTNQGKELDAYTLWHRRLGHAGKEKMKLFQVAVEGIPALVPGRRLRKSTESDGPGHAIHRRSDIPASSRATELAGARDEAGSSFCCA